MLTQRSHVFEIYEDSEGRAAVRFAGEKGCRGHMDLVRSQKSDRHSLTGDAGNQKLDLFQGLARSTPEGVAV